MFKNIEVVLAALGEGLGFFWIACSHEFPPSAQPSCRKNRFGKGRFSQFFSDLTLLFCIHQATTSPYHGALCPRSFGKGDALEFGTEDLRYFVHPCPIGYILLLQIPLQLRGFWQVH